MACEVLNLIDGCYDVSGADFVVDISSDDTDFSQDIKADLMVGRRPIKSYSLGDGITLSSYGGFPNRRLNITVSDGLIRYVGRCSEMYIRPTSDKNDVFVQKISITNKYAKQ